MFENERRKEKHALNVFSTCQTLHKNAINKLCVFLLDSNFLPGKKITVK